MNTPIDFSEFPDDREQGLRAIKRYSMFETMYYRTTVWLHAHRVSWLLEESLPTAMHFLQLNPEKARVLALVHDDSELITGDIQAGAKMKMNAQQLQAVDSGEAQAIDVLANQYPTTVHGYNYRELLLHALHKDCIEAQLVCYFDKLEAYGESIHEVLAGNKTFLPAVIFYSYALALFPYKFPQLAPFLSAQHPFTMFADRAPRPKIENSMFENSGVPHTVESLVQGSIFPFHTLWCKTTMTHGDTEAQEWLTNQQEYLI